MLCQNYCNKFTLHIHFSTKRTKQATQISLNHDRVTFLCGKYIILFSISSCYTSNMQEKKRNKIMILHFTDLHNGFIKS